jgi:hydroxymethylbilane synthase
MRIGTRASALALAQAELVGEELRRRGAVDRYELVPVLTSGDRGVAGGDKSRWVSELEQALLGGRVDIAVHSAKDVPAQIAPGLALLGAPPRAAAEDALCGSAPLDQLAHGARVGTSSLRRRAQLKAARSDLEVVSMRGNVDTRLRKLAGGEGELDAIVLARAALSRLGRDDACAEVLEAKRFVPAPGQGTLALEGREGDGPAQGAASAIGDAFTLDCLRAERALARALSASCNTPLGAHAQAAGGGRLRLRGWVGLADGTAWILDELLGPANAPEALGEEVAQRMRLAGAGEILQAAEQAVANGAAGRRQPAAGARPARGSA